MLFLLQAGCFPMGLPEYFYGGYSPAGKATDKGRAPAALIVVSEPTFSFEHKGGREVLGYQFLLGLFPFTHVYLEHGLDSQLLELTAERLSDEGYRVYLAAGEENVLAAARHIRPQLMLQVALEEPSLHAYDALFFRILSFSGELRVSWLEPAEKGTAIRPRREKRVSLSEREYRRFGHGPWLSYLLERAVRDGLGEAFTDAVPRRSASLARPAATAVSPVLLTMPLLSNGETVEVLGALASGSYGYGGLPPYSPRALARLMQRGMTAALLERELPVIAELGSSVDMRVTGLRRLRLLHPTVRLLPEAPEAPTELELHAEVALEEERGGSAYPQPLLQARCRWNEPLETERDGYWAVTIERAAGSIVERFLSADQKYCRFTGTQHGG